MKINDTVNYEDCANAISDVLHEFNYELRKAEYNHNYAEAKELRERIGFWEAMSLKVDRKLRACC